MIVLINGDYFSMKKSFSLVNIYLLLSMFLIAASQQCFHIPQCLAWKKVVPLSRALSPQEVTIGSATGKPSS